MIAAFGLLTLTDVHGVDNTIGGRGEDETSIICPCHLGITTRTKLTRKIDHSTQATSPQLTTVK
jgi:hypothetical protein